MRKKRTQPTPDQDKRFVIRIALSVMSLFLVLGGIIWMQREAKRLEENRAFLSNPERMNWIEAKRVWINSDSSSRALWSGEVTRFVSGKSEDLKAVELERCVCRIGVPGLRDGKDKLYINVSQLGSVDLPAFEVGGKWLILVERDEDGKNFAMDAKLMLF